MPSITVYIPAEVTWLGPLSPSTEMVRFAAAAEVVWALASGGGPVVLLSDGLTASDVAAIADAVRRSSRAVIEVRSERWDGQTESELSAACRGVISGFGLDGIAAAVALLEREAAAPP